ncbi:PqqD family protein [Erythrobacter sp. KY5]|nr:PqqD family protein [Erythrobacter sp. KY5]
MLWGILELLMQLSDRFAVSADVVAREVGGELVLLDLSSGQYFGLDPVGGRIWELLAEGPRELAQLCDSVEAEFDAPRDRIEADLLSLAKQLKDQDLIVAA